MVLKRVGIWSLAKLLAVTYGTLGFVFGGIFGLVSYSLGGLFPGKNLFLGSGLSLTSFVLYPLIYAVVGLIGGAFSAALYNIFASIAGGVQLELRDSNLEKI
jgi:hypothetical protein